MVAVLFSLLDGPDAWLSSARLMVLWTCENGILESLDDSKDLV